MTVLGTVTKRSAIAIAKTARTSQTNIKTNNKNIILALSPMILLLISAMLRPFSLRLTIKAPKSCAAPIKIVPSIIHKNAGNQPQYAATHGPMIGAAPAIEVK